MAHTRRFLGIAAALLTVTVAATACSDGGPAAVVTPSPDKRSQAPGGDKEEKATADTPAAALPDPTAMPVPPLLAKRTAPLKNGGNGNTPASIPKSGNCLKGVGTWGLTAGQKALTGSGACWFYTWSPNDWFGAPPGVEFVPMIWSGRDIGKVGEVRGKTLLGFNEPDLAGQANMSVEEALNLWPQLQKTGMRLGSPAPVWGGDIPGRWLDQFMTGARQRGLRVDFIALHFYTKNYDTATAVNELKTYIQRVRARFGKPIWLTEFALINHDNGMSYPPVGQQAAFVRAATSMLTALPYVERYAWFALPNTRGNGTGLMTDDGTPTEPGREFQRAPRTR
ncbi:glycoside hydrolase family protein [Actinocorallia longicatena]|uniref:Asl1-like glycosyl hydrolase catalytic domain-containing protein n=1 Tax=Actinocorallia longicatena TaxID=111803 RepID=A0ABP6Q013_9ACTN